MQAILLAGGFGTRLQSAIGTDIPKPMAPLAGEPFLAHYIRYLRAQGVTRVVLSVHHLRESIMAYFKDDFEGVTIAYAQEETPLGTGGAVRFALEAARAEAPVLVINGDSFVELNIPAMLAAHRAASAPLTIALHRMPDCSRYGEAELDADGRIAQFTYPGRAQEGWISTGAYVVNPDIFNGYALPAAFSFESDFQRPFVARLRPLAWLAEGYFIDIGIPADYARAEAELIPFMKATQAA